MMMVELWFSGRPPVSSEVILWEEEEAESARGGATSAPEAEGGGCPAGPLRGGSGPLARFRESFWADRVLTALLDPPSNL